MHHYYNIVCVCVCVCVCECVCACACVRVCGMCVQVCLWSQLFQLHLKQNKIKRCTSVCPCPSTTERYTAFAHCGPLSPQGARDITRPLLTPLHSLSDGNNRVPGRSPRTSRLGGAPPTDEDMVKDFCGDRSPRLDRSPGTRCGDSRTTDVWVSTLALNRTDRMTGMSGT